MKSGERVKQATNNWRALFCYQSVWKKKNLLVTIATGRPQLQHCYQQTLKSNLQHFSHSSDIGCFPYCALQTCPLTPGSSLHRDNLNRASKALQVCIPHSCPVDWHAAFHFSHYYSVITLKFYKAIQLTNMGQEKNSDLTKECHLEEQETMW